MVHARTNRLIEHLQAAPRDFAGVDATDAQLLERYIASRDSASFAAIVHRHGPMVWGVCRRMLPEHQDAEDAFQATFLVLVRKAASVVPRHMIGNWLHGVARQTALKARAMAIRRSMRERQVVDMPETEKLAADNWSDLQAVIDEELARLPSRYRAVLLLCDLEGKTRKEAARNLGVPSGSVAGWLVRARALLAKRLVRRGVTLAGGSLTATLVRMEASARLPALMVSQTIEAASRYAAGPLAAEAVRAPVAALTEGVLRSMLLTKLKSTLAVIVAAGLFCTGLTGIAIQATGQEPKPKVKPAADPQVEKPKPGTPEAPADLRQLKQEVDKLRAELDAVKKQLAGSSKSTVVDPTPKNEEGDPKFVVRVYPVATLMSEKDKDDSLVRVLTKTVKPSSWYDMGGLGTIEYFASGKSLIVNQTEDVHLQIEKLISELQKVKEKQDNDATGRLLKQ